MTKLFFSLILSLFVSQIATAQERPTEFEAGFEESDFDTKPWMREFQYVVVVNKATEGMDKQTVRVYQNGHRVTLQQVEAFIQAYGSKDSQKRLGELADKTRNNDTFMVSTGRDAFETKGEHGSQNASWTVTPTGYFMPQYFDPKHRSTSYSKKGCGGLFGKIAKLVTGKEACAVMENAIFFNGPIALHKAIPGTEGALGEKASGGCVRLPGALADFLYQNIMNARDPRGVPAVDNNGNLKLDANGQAVYTQTSQSIWGSLEARSALIIVQNKIVQ
jgi:lipoprotein-anchoring transpeptidase ErfK/SrfK